MNKLSYPILIYDNLCYSCTRYAKIVNALLKNKCLIVGHYTELGKEIKKQLFPEDYDGIEMSWFIIDGDAYGGRAALFRLARFVVFGRKDETFPKNVFDLTECGTDCNTMRDVFLRMFSMLTTYKKFRFIK